MGAQQEISHDEDIPEIEKNSNGDAALSSVTDEEQVATDKVVSESDNLQDQHSLGDGLPSTTGEADKLVSELDERDNLQNEDYPKVSEIASIPPMEASKERSNVSMDDVVFDTSSETVANPLFCAGTSEVYGQVSEWDEENKLPDVECSKEAYCQEQPLMTLYPSLCEESSSTCSPSAPIQELDAPVVTRTKYIQEVECATADDRPNVIGECSMENVLPLPESQLMYLYRNYQLEINENVIESFVEVTMDDTFISYRKYDKARSDNLLCIDGRS